MSLQNIKFGTLPKCLLNVSDQIFNIFNSDREKFGLIESLVRFSVGIEDVEDLIRDVQKALG